MTRRESGNLRGIGGGIGIISGVSAKKLKKEDRPLIDAVQPEIKKMNMEDYLVQSSAEDKHLPEHVRGRSRCAPELSVLEETKNWALNLRRMAVSEGYASKKGNNSINMSLFFKQSENVTPADRRLYEAVDALVRWEAELIKLKS